MDEEATKPVSFTGFDSTVYKVLGIIKSQQQGDPISVNPQIPLRKELGAEVMSLKFGARVYLTEFLDRCIEDEVLCVNERERYELSPRGNKALDELADRRERYHKSRVQQ